jgi:hypothetical protein
MLRAALCAVAVLALAGPARSADQDLSGNWIFVAQSPPNELPVCLLKFETKGGKTTVAASSPGAEVTATDVRVTPTRVAVTVKRVRMIGDREFTELLPFEGVRGKDPKVILGSTGTERYRNRARLVATDKEQLTPADLTVRRIELPEQYTKIAQLNTQALQAANKARTERDAEKKKELQKAADEARKDADEKIPVLYREVVEKHADSPAAFDAALTLLRGAARNKLTADEAAKCVKVLLDEGTPYGPLYTAVTIAPVAETLAGRKGLEAVAITAIEPVAKSLPDDLPAAVQSAVLTAYQTALTKAGKAAEAKDLGTRIAKLEEKIDAEYLKTVPPFKPTSFAGRKDKNANQVVMMELFTGAQCPPCVAADAAFDALVKTYKPTDLVLVQYHMHIPGPDPMTNPDTTARWDYYRKLMPEGIRGVPTSLFNGKPETGGGGAMAAAENKYGQYTRVIDPLLEKTTPVKIAGKATRRGDKIDIAVEVAGADAADMKLRLLVVEETVKYAGSNGIRFHHHVVRAMPGGAGGVAVKGESFKHTAAVDLGEVRKGLTNYLDDFVAQNPNRPFARPDRPMDMKAVRVIAMVQNDKTGEIAQAAQIEVEGEGAGGGQ